MKHEERIENLKRMYKLMLERLEKHDPKHLPASIDMRKLELAYDELEEYEYVLKKK
ncbi:MAG: hypothetical protein KGH60_03140 [Candidatus Micrarchaeota archaeon]|nr:hypothetical protein [Candidatus Micrarchaeota archaeon]